MCSAGGDRTLCHNALRNFFYRRLLAAGLHPELEKPGLLIPARPEDSSQTARRPADVYLPSWITGGPAALDFAVTAPQRRATLLQAAEKPLAAASDYVVKKREHLDSQALCEAQGIAFLPMVVESTGAWAPESAKVVYQLASAVATATGKDVKEVHRELLEGAAGSVRKARAKAVLKRAGHEMLSNAGAMDTAASHLAAPSQ